jgi:glyoxalase family protein
MIAVGSVRHAAFRVPHDAALERWRERLAALHGVVVSPVEDHVSFRSMSFVEPGGGRLALATDGLGALAGGGAATTGTRLTLPPWLEHRRAHLMGVLPALRLPGAEEQSDAP